MSTVVFPKTVLSAPPRLETIAHSILDHDQLDDWLPDPVYFRDLSGSLPEMVRWIEDTARSGATVEIGDESFDLPRIGVKGPLRGKALPFGVRVCAHKIIAGLAPRLGAALVRDKVYGFQYRADKLPLFSLPGDELDRVFRLVFEAARVSNSETHIADIVAYNTNIDSSRLTALLAQNGAAAADIACLRRLAEVQSGGVATIDDGFAFLYNTYLIPVDAALAKAQMNFFRYRDEYFVFAEADRSTLDRELTKIGLRSRLLRKMARPSTVTGKSTTMRRTLHRNEYGEFMAWYECRQAENQCSDEFEFDSVTFDRREGGPDELFAIKADAEPIDAVQVMPMLRTINKVRQSAVHLAAPFSGADQTFKAYQRHLETGRNWLKAALAVAVERNVGWQVGWAAELLSDLGPLDADPLALIVRALRSTNLTEGEKSRLRVVLARSSKTKGESWWRDPATTDSPYVIRASILAASHLARRGETQLWQRLQSGVGRREGPLMAMLRP